MPTVVGSLKVAGPRPFIDATAWPYNATGDGSTDDTTAINNAITAANAAGGGTVLLGPSTYIAGQIVPKADVELRGAGMQATTLKLKAATNANAMAATNAHRFVLRDLTIDGNDVNQGAGNWSGILLTTSHRVVIERVRMINVDWIGIALAGCQYGQIAECDVDTPDYIGVWVATSGATHSTGTRVVRNRIYSCGLDGVIIDCDDVEVVENWIEATGRVTGASGVYVSTDRRRVRVENNTCTGTTNFGIDLDNATTDDNYGCVVVGNVCVSNTNSGIGCDSSGAVITGNTCLNNGQASGTYPYGILLDAKNIVCVGNRCSDTQGTKTQTYGMAVRNASGVTTSLTIVGNDISGNTNTGILNLTTIGSNHQVLANRGIVNSLVDRLGVGVLTPDHGLHISSSGNDHLRLQRTGASGVFESYIGSSREWVFGKANGSIAGSANQLFRFLQVGNVDGSDPFWNGFQWTGHNITQGGSGVFPILTLYSRSAVLADPTDYEFLFSAGNASSRPLGISFGSFNVANSFVRFGFGDGAISQETMRLLYDGTNSFVGIGTNSPSHKLQVAQGTITTNIRGIDHSATWNEANTDFEALRLSVTNTLSGANARLANFLVAGSTVASIEKDGVIASTVALRTKHEGTNNTPSGGASGDIRVGTWRLWFNDGGTWRDITRDGLSAITSAVTVANTTNETSLLTVTLPANFLKVGTSIRLTASGVAGTTSSAPTWTFRVRIGSVGSVLTGNIVTSIAPTPAISQTAKGWQVDALITLRTTGSSGTIIGNGVCANELSATAPNDNKLSATTGTVVVDTTQQRDLALTVQWGTANAANTITAHNVAYDVVVA